MSVFDDLVRDRALHAFKLTTDPTIPNKGLSQKAAVVNGAVASNGLPLYAGGEKPLAFTQSTSVKLTDTLHTDRTMECLYAPSTNDAGLIMRNGQVSVEEIAGVLRLNLYQTSPDDGQLLATNYEKNPDMSQTDGEVVVIENLIKNPSGEYAVDASDWNAGAALDGTMGKVGSTSFLLGGNNYRTEIQAANSGVTYTYAAWVLAPVGSDFRIRVGGSAMEPVPISDIYLGTGEWQRVSMTVTTALAGSVAAYPVYGLDVQANVDGITLVEGGYDPGAFDGDTPADDTFTYRWTGTPGASSSQKVARKMYGWSWNGIPAYQYIYNGRTWLHGMPGETSIAGAAFPGPRPVSQAGQYWAAKFRVYNFSDQAVNMRSGLYNGAVDGFITEYPPDVPVGPNEEIVISLKSAIPVSQGGNTGPYFYFYQTGSAIITDVVYGPVSGPGQELSYEYFSENSNSSGYTYIANADGTSSSTLDYATAPTTIDIEWDREQSHIALTKSNEAVTLRCNDETVAIEVPEDFVWNEDNDYVLAPTGGYADAFAVYDKVVSDEELSRHLESSRRVPEYESVLNSLTPAPDVPLTDYEETPVDLDDTLDAPPAPYGYWMGTDNERIVTDTRTFDTSDDFLVADMLSVDIGDDEITGIHTEETIESTNYITNPAPASTTDMTGTGGAVAFDTDHIVLTSSIDSVNRRGVYVNVGQQIAATPDEESYFDSQVRSAQGIVTRIFATFYDATAVEILTAEGETSTGAAEWEDLSSSFTTPAGAAFVQFSIGNDSSISIGDTIEAKQFTTVPDGYYDGDTPDDEVYRYDWTGTAGASTSTKTAIEQFGTWTGSVPIPETTAKLAWQGAGDFTVSLSADNGTTWQQTQNNAIIPTLPTDENSGVVDIKIEFGAGGGVVRRILAREYQDSIIKGILTERNAVVSGDVTTNEEDNFPIEQNPLAGFRFNGGSLTIPEVVGSEAVQSVMFWIKPEAAPVGNLLTIGTTTITADLSGAYVNGQAGGSLQIGAWNSVILTDIPATTADIVLTPPVGQVTMLTIMSETITAEDAAYLYDCFFSFPRFQFSDADVTIAEAAVPFNYIQQDWGITSSY